MIRLLPRILVVSAALCSAIAASAENDFAAAKLLLEQRRFPEAREILEKVVATDPRHAAAQHALGRVWLARGDRAALESAANAFAKAVELEPANPFYLGDYGGTLLQLAQRTTSISAAMKGRDAMEKAVSLKPDHVDAREGLYQFYQRAPWPLGSNAKAAAHLEAIRRHAPDRATVLSVLLRVRARDFPGAFQLCDGVLAKDPTNYIALYQYGRTASLSGQNLERGHANLKKCLALEPPSPASPAHTHVWFRIGSIEEQLKHPAEARAAYETALQLDASNTQAAAALATLK